MTPKLPPPAAQRTEQVGVLVPVGADQLAVGGDQLDRGEAVRGQAQQAGVPADAAAQGVPGDADVGGGAVQGGQAVCGGGLDGRLPDGADAGAAGGRVDGDLVQGAGAEEDEG